MAEKRSETRGSLSLVSRARPFTRSLHEGRVRGLTCSFHVQVEFEVTCKADDIRGQ